MTSGMSLPHPPSLATVAVTLLGDQDRPSAWDSFEITRLGGAQIICSCYQDRASTITTAMPVTQAADRPSTKILLRAAWHASLRSSSRSGRKSADGASTIATDTLMAGLVVEWITATSVRPVITSAGHRNTLAFVVCERQATGLSGAAAVSLRSAARTVR
ncbi:MAG: hypothetical protein IPN02_14375 [Candidatus Microthrix sp.]|uniref:Uncharacterized protein n=1 Tax=Candidatus Neomicrothrix subdominans TaxID=2954438 RepID=A0A936TGR2_9ACTN|nr:hypothetical protein [Candidatus Microthrix subdominans]